MRDSDIDRSLELCRAAQWNQVRADWEYFLINSACLVAELNEQVVGTCAVLNSQGPRAWIAMMLVDPAARRQSIGTLLFEHALALTTAPSIGLDATALGRPLYEKHSFEPTSQIVRWHRPPGPRGTPPAKPTSCSWRMGHLSDHIGPVLANSVDEAANQVLTCLAANPARSWILDVPQLADPAWHAWLEATKFTPQRTFIRMYRGAAEAITPDTYATSGPEFGP